MQYQQILDNLARFSDNPGSLPYFAVTGSGEVQITDRAESSGGLGFISPGGFDSGTLGVGAARDVTENWALASVTSFEKLQDLREIFRSQAIGNRQGNPANQWFHVGCKRDVPKEAYYVGRYAGTYVWVMPQDLDALTNLTLNVVNIATVDDTKGAAGGVPPAAPLSAPSATMGGPSRLNFSAPTRGPLFTPGR